MTIRRTVLSLGVCAGLLLATAGCGGSDDASRTACDDFDAAYTEYSQGVGAAKSPAAAGSAYDKLADTLDEIAGRDGLDSELATQVRAGAEAARAAAETPETGLDVETDKTLRATFDICTDIKS